MFPEYNEAKKELDAVYKKAKDELAVKVRPIFFKKFEELFEQFPEIDNVYFELRTDIYNDETYDSGIESIHIYLKDEYCPEDFNEDYDYGWEDYSSALTWDDTRETFIEKMGSLDRVREVQTRIEQFGYFLYRLDYDFLSNVFGSYCDVTVNRKGFTVE